MTGIGVCPRRYLRKSSAFAMVSASNGGSLSVTMRRNSASTSAQSSATRYLPFFTGFAGGPVLSGIEISVLLRQPPSRGMDVAEDLHRAGVGGRHERVEVSQAGRHVRARDHG